MCPKIFAHTILILIIYLPGLLPWNLCAQTSWSTTLDNLGTFSSPRMIDCNEDGTLDIILGAGRQEFLPCDSAIFALDGKSGQMLWKVAARDQVFGSAACKDITGDGVPEIFIGGRSAELKAINGKNGEVLWDYYPQGDSVLARKMGLFNFYNPQFIPDQNQDGYEDILIANGGDVVAEAYDPNRLPGHLMIISGKEGALIAKAPMPDEKEIYMSAVIDDLDNDGTLDIIYGTGGETLRGNLFRARLEDVLSEDLSNSQILASGDKKGFIAPPVLVDITQDDIKDIIVNSVDGRMLAFDGKTNELLWGGQIPNTEAYSSLGVGEMTGDDIPDFFAMYAIGTWPDLESTRPFLVDGAKGEIAIIDSIGFYQTSSPIIADFNADGHDDAMISVNFGLEKEESGSILHNVLLVYDFVKRGKYAISTPLVGSNVASTPWVGDMDNDGYMDIIYCQMTTPDKAYTYEGFRVNRMVTQVPIHSGVSWGAYMGNQYTGIYDNDKNE